MDLWGFKKWRRKLRYIDYANAPISPEPSASVGSILMQSERHPNNESALRSAVRPRETMTLFVAFIVEDDGNVIWSGPELLREIDARNGSIGEKTTAAKAPSSR